MSTDNHPGYSTPSGEGFCSRMLADAACALEAGDLATAKAKTLAAALWTQREAMHLTSESRHSEAGTARKQAEDLAAMARSIVADAVSPKPIERTLKINVDANGAQGELAKVESALTKVAAQADACTAALERMKAIYAEVSPQAAGA